jgi:amino acid adenylation domain-containing protein
MTYRRRHALDDIAIALAAPHQSHRADIAERSAIPAAIRHDRCLHQLFQAQAERTPDIPAVVAPAAGRADNRDERLTYRELNARANQLAHHLRRLGVGPEVLVGICMERSIELVIGMLGVLKAGGAYVPLDPAYPDDRLRYMLADTQAPVLLTQQSMYDVRCTIDNYPTIVHPYVICLDAEWDAIAHESSENPADAALADHLAFVIYTSGSTGRPKGVCCRHRGVVNLLADIERRKPLMPGDGCSVWTSPSFDVSVYEIFSALVAGGTVQMVPEEVRANGRAFGRWLADRAIRSAYIPPFMLPEIAAWLEQHPGRSSLRRLLVGVEPIAEQLLVGICAHVPGLQIINGYGPTEASICATLYDVDPTATHDRTTPIGQPVWNMEVYLLDQNLRPVPAGEAGELYIGGIGLAQGYLNRPELTAERFIPNPFTSAHNKEQRTKNKAQDGAHRSSNGEHQDQHAENDAQPICNLQSAICNRLYKTGDLARYLPDGQIEFLGRIDHQVKIRGFRIELGEIEAVLGQHPAVRACVVVAREDMPGEKQLVAYIVPIGDQGSGVRGQEALAEPRSPIPEPRTLIPDLRDFLKQRLPDHMVPSAFVLLDALPITTNGKIDRRALPAPDLRRISGDYVAPRSVEEQLLAGIWTAVLGLERVGVDDNFFAIGGHSLSAAQVAARASQAYQIELSMKSLFEAPTIAELARLIARTRRDQRGAYLDAIQALPREGDLPLSFSQERVWFLQQLNPAATAYHFQATLSIAGPLDVAALERSLGEIVRRHEIFRTTFPASRGRPVQLVHAAQPVHLPVIDLQATPDRVTAMQEQIDAELRAPFDLTRLPLVRWTLLRLSLHEHVLIHVEHHLLHDGWSFNLFLRELLETYQAFCAGRPSPLPEPPIQFVDFAVWQRRWMQSETAATQRAYWTRQLAGSPPVLDLPADHPRPPLQSFRGAAARIELPIELCESLRALSRAEGVTLFMTLLSAFLTLLQRYTQQEDLCVGSGVANRRRGETEGLIGMIVNTVALRTDVSGNPTFRELLGRVREVALAAYAHEDLPFGSVIESLHPDRDLSHMPLYQVMFSAHDSPLPRLELPGLSVDLLEGISNGSAKCDLNVVVIPRAEQHVGQGKSDPAGITMVWEYSTDLFEPDTIARMIENYQTLLGSIVADPARRLAELPILSASQRQQLLSDWNATDAQYPRDRCFHELFEAQVARTPDTVAVAFEGRQLTYRELNARANQLGHHLRALGVGPDVLVGLCVERSLEMIVGILGILKAGGAYVPLDPNYPKDRLAMMIDDSRAPVILTQKAIYDLRFTIYDYETSAPAIENRKPTIVNLDADWPTIAEHPADNAPCAVLGDHRAYVIYTSGSTGRPKGVMVRQRGLINLCYGLRAFFDHPAVQHTGLITSISFDISVNQIFPTLLFGRTLHIVPEEVKLDSSAFIRFLQDQQIQLLDGVPSYMQAVLKEVALRRIATDLRYLLIGGEKLEQPLLEAIFTQLGQDVAIVNIYGLTEITDINAFSVIRAADLGRTITVGRPLQNNRIYLTDRYGGLQPVGVVGEVCIAGESLSRGYLNRPELTAEKFVPCPFEDGTLMCRTGDLGRRQPDGTIVILGRIDHQVKIRGYRIELGEVEAALRQYPALRECVVVAREDVPSDTRLVAYVVPIGGQESGFGGQEALAEPRPLIPDPRSLTPELRDFLKQRLPDYMIPSAFVALDMLPRTPNGKLDRRALPAPDHVRPTQHDTYAAPRTEVERLLADLWGALLGLERVGVHDDFFALGGHSLLATSVIAQVRDMFELELPLRSMFEGPTIAELGATIERAIFAEIDQLSEEAAQHQLSTIDDRR